MSCVMINTTVDTEELVKQYQWLATLRGAYKLQDKGMPPQLESLVKHLEDVGCGIWGPVHIYGNKPIDPTDYLVLMPGHDADVYLISPDKDEEKGGIRQNGQESTINWTQFHDELVPVGYMWSWSIMEVEANVRACIQHVISSNLEFYEKFITS